MAMTLNFHCEIWNLPYLNQIWSDCREMKSKCIDWILSNKCSHRVRPWLWSWPWIFKVKFWNSRISGIGGPIGIEQPGVIDDNDLWVTKMRCKELPDSDQMSACCRLILLISIIEGCIRIWLSIVHTKSIRNRYLFGCCWAPNSFVRDSHAGSV